MARHPHACEALRLSSLLTDGELLVLMASQRVAKSGASYRVFSRSDLEKPSVLRPLLVLREALPQCLAGLVRKGMLVRRGRQGFEATTPGNTVKHTFNEAAHSLLLGPAGAALRDRRHEWRAVLRDEVQRICRHQ
ncbi:MAG TPA: hypothetical protein VJ547_08175 [Candidatus Thermoplasmatota archaeon]|nr:hypothetical protein [Candidatus Thermoplasmatota archaeon]